jgi:ABC-type phosphate transport system auxiliary subunit
MNSFFVVLLVCLPVTILFAILWSLASGKLKTALKKIEAQERINEDVKSRYARAVKDAGDARAMHESKYMLAIQEAEERIANISEKFSGIISQEWEITRLKQHAVNIAEQIASVQSTYAEKRKILDRLEEQVAVYDERLAFAELGVYEPHFDFGDSEDFKSRIIEVRERQKTMISSKIATHCPTDWTVEGSKSKGQTMINRQTRLSLRAFNNECDAAVANARWNNVVAMEKRILSAEQAINKENSTLNLRINDEYLVLKLEELRLTHEYRERLKIEKEERFELARSEREEKKLLAEADAAEREEKKYQILLEKARKEIGTGAASEEMKKRIADLEAALREASEASERARAMAEMTKSGYVYIISNVGSFGADVVKIGLTRRLEPDDRVRELGGASVPFAFDTHAMIYSDEAPALEAALHREFAELRINMSNMRKEFFRVTLDEVEEAVYRLAPDASFFKDREAQEWYETLARRKQMLTDMQTEFDRLPAEI